MVTRLSELKKGAANATANNLAPRSTSVHYEVRLQELLCEAGCQDDSPKPDARRLACFLFLLDELLKANALGSLTILMGKITAEMRKSIFSDEVVSRSLPASVVHSGSSHTDPPGGGAAGEGTPRGGGGGAGASAGGGLIDPEANFEYVPYFSQLHDCKKEVEVLRVAASESAAKGLEAERKLGTAEALLRGDGPEADNLRAKINLLEYELVKTKGELECLKSETQHHKVRHAKEMLVVEDEVRRWKKDVDATRVQLQDLKRKADEAETVKKAFEQLQRLNFGQQDPTQGGEVPLGFSKEDTEAVKLEGQLLVLQNARINEYEAALDAAPSRAQAKAIRAAFVEELSQLQHELSLLRDHIMAEQAKKDSPQYKQGEGRIGADGVVVGRGGGKFLELSIDGGKTYKTLEEDGVTSTVGMATRVPPGVTHMRWTTRGRGLPSTSTIKSSTPQVPNLQRPDELARKQRLSSAEAGALGLDPSGNPRGTPGEADMSGPLWDGFRQACQGDLERAVPQRARVLQLPQLLRMLEEMMAAHFRIQKKSTSILQRGSSNIENNEDPDFLIDHRAYLPLREFFYLHLKEKYVLQQTVILVAHSILSAIEVHRKSHAVVQLMARVMSGELDEAAWRYTMHWRRLLHQLPVASTRDFQSLMKVLYPMARDEELEDLSITFATQSSEAASPSAATEFLTGRVLAKQELRLRKWFKILKWKDSHHRNSFRREEFMEICAKMFPHAKQALVSAEYDAAARRYGGERVPLECLAYVACCLDAMQLKYTPIVNWEADNSANDNNPRLVEVS